VDAKTAAEKYDTDAEIATAVWNAATASYGTTNTYGAFVESLPSASTVVDAVWDEVVSGHLTWGTFGWMIHALFGEQ
jgi:hypothetical protein